MFYKIKVWSAEDYTQRTSFYIKETCPIIHTADLQEFYQKATNYQVRVVKLPPKVTQLSEKYRVWDTLELEKHIRNLKFYTHKEYTVEDYMEIPNTKFLKKPFEIENSYYLGKWYSFFKKPDYNIINSLIEVLVIDIDPCSKYLYPIKEDKYHNPYSVGKFIWTQGNGYVCLNKLIGVCTIIKNEELSF